MAKDNEMREFKPTIGLEIHAELATQTKMFCDSVNDPEEKHPNVNVCPVCLGHPGTLPVPNRDAVVRVLKTGLALGGRINPVTKFDRKNYFYPDLPKGYQISQYDFPLISEGTLNGVRVRRIHLEEDTGTLVHDDAKVGAASTAKYSLIDYNRAGVPLMELVTEPDISSADQAVAFARELQLILRYLGVSNANMEKGEMRIEANVSLNMGTKVELKNINSFKAVHDAVEYELKRQEEAISRGEEIKQETRGWDEVRRRTVSRRTKEEAHDYRYFPEPDIPPFETAEFKPDELRLALPELPEEKRKRFISEYRLDPRRSESLVAEPELAAYFEEAVSELGAAFGSVKTDTAAVQISGSATQTLYNYLTSDLRGLMNENGTEFADLKVSPEHLAHLSMLIEDKKVTSRQAKDVLSKMFSTGEDPEYIAKNENVGVSTDIAEIEAVVLAVIGENNAAVADYKKGKTASMQFLIGKAMAALKGRAQPDMLRELFTKNLSG